MRKKSLLEHILSGLAIGNGCWDWRAHRGCDGYGRLQVRIGGKKLNFLAHRVVYEMVLGKIPTDLQIDHLCRNKSCVRPDHLEPVTRAENMRRMGPFQVLIACRKGHVLVEGNIVPAAKGYSRCKTCRLDRQRKRYERLRAEGRCGCGGTPDPGYKCCHRCLEQKRKRAA